MRFSPNTVRKNELTPLPERICEQKLVQV